ncbi:MAG: Hsp33 family molecular chaperone HslO [Oscillospiraceae bacterium]
MHVGSTELVSGEIAEDLSAYLVERADPRGLRPRRARRYRPQHVKAAGGLLVQLMPGAPEELITKLEDNIFMMDQLTTILDEDGADAILPQVMRGLEPEIVLRHPMAYRCACSRARVEQALRQCGAQELQDMIAEGKDTQVHCQFCDAEYSSPRRSCRRCSTPKNADAAAD